MTFCHLSENGGANTHFVVALRFSFDCLQIHNHNLFQFLFDSLSLLFMIVRFHTVCIRWPLFATEEGYIVSITQPLLLVSLQSKMIRVGIDPSKLIEGGVYYS